MFKFSEVNLMFLDPLDIIVPTINKYLLKNKLVELLFKLNKS